VITISAIIVVTAAIIAAWWLTMARRPDGTGTPPLADYIRSRDPGGSRDWIEHLHGVDWYDAPVPPHRHTCWPQTRGWIDGEMSERCACGAFRYADLGVWIDRNTRRPRTPAEEAAHQRGKVIDGLMDDYHEAETALRDGTGPREVMLARMNEIRAQVRELLDEQENA
jgi:hypothetical protein